MVKAMIEQTPEYYLKFRKNFRYFIAYTEPKISSEMSKNYAFGLHTDDHDIFCPVREKHYHLLLEIDGHKPPKQGEHRVPCVYSTYFLLLHASQSLHQSGQIFLKLQRAVHYNEKMGENSFFKQPKRNHEKIPRPKSMRNIAVQTAEMSNCFLERISDILNGCHAASFLRLFDIMVDGHGILQTDSISFVLRSD